MRKPRPENETPEKRFKRLAAARTNKLLQQLKVLGNCSNTSIYQYEKEDVDKIFTEIEKLVKETKTRFHYPSRKTRFKL